MFKDRKLLKEFIMDDETANTNLYKKLCGLLTNVKKKATTYHYNGESLTVGDMGKLTTAFYRRLVGTPEEPVLLRPCFDITTRCNLACKYCYMNSGPWEPKTFMPLADVKHFTDAFQNIPALKFVEFGGGEPFNAPTKYLEEIFSYSASHGNFIDVHTNGNFINNPTKTKEIIEILRRYPRAPDGGPMIQLSISSDSSTKTNYDKKFDFVQTIMKDPELNGHVHPILFVYEKSVEDYFNIMKEKNKQEKSSIKAVKRNHDEKTGNNSMLFESNGCQFGICDCNFSKLADKNILTESGFAPNNGDHIAFGNPVAMAFSIDNATNADRRGKYKSLGMLFLPDGNACVLIDLVQMGRVKYKLEDGSYDNLGHLIWRMAVKLAIESTDEGAAKTRAELRQRFDHAEMMRQKIYSK